MMDAGKKWADNDLIFSDRAGGCLSYRTVYDRFKRVMTKLGLPDRISFSPRLGRKASRSVTAA